MYISSAIRPAALASVVLAPMRNPCLRIQRSAVRYGRTRHSILEASKDRWSCVCVCVNSTQPESHSRTKQTIKHAHYILRCKVNVCMYQEGELMCWQTQNTTGLKKTCWAYQTLTNRLQQGLLAFSKSAEAMNAIQYPVYPRCLWRFFAQPDAVALKLMCSEWWVIN